MKRVNRVEQASEAAKIYSEDEYNRSVFENGFINGAKWADEHPVDVWHDASERPKDNSEILVQWNIKGNSGYESYYTCCIENWDRFIGGYGVSRWAYISDIVPKGGAQ